ncbi:MAG: hypothetical protein QF570_00820 [Myxococcota bacterium]|jgi:hypothetical protein|nr:hypothetical protein [Myxococcota bacterium]
MRWNLRQRVLRGSLSLAIACAAGAACALGIAGAASAQTTARLLYVDGAEVRDAEIDVVRTLVESDLIAHPDVLLLSDRDPEDAQMDITGQLTKLGESYLLILTARFEDGQQRSRRQKIASFDEIDVASQRLVAALVENVEVFDTVERGAVLEREQESEELVASDFGFELGFGTAWPLSASTRGSKWGTATSGPRSPGRIPTRVLSSSVCSRASCCCATRTSTSTCAVAS